MDEPVSLWLGSFNSGLSFQEYMKIGYTDDCDSLPSIFHTVFDLCDSDFDIDFVEQHKLSEYCCDLSIILKNHSYSSRLVEAFENIILTKGYNVVVLIYGFDYSKVNNPIGRNVSHDGVLDYIGVREIDMSDN